jgi:hypothetical protein
MSNMFAEAAERARLVLRRQVNTERRYCNAKKTALCRNPDITGASMCYPQSPRSAYRTHARPQRAEAAPVIIFYPFFRDF